MKVEVAGVKVDRVGFDEAVEIILGWLEKPGRHFVVTPNLEIIRLAGEDPELRKILNEADLAIPDSARIGWLYGLTRQKSLFGRLVYLSLGLVPKFGQLIPFDTVTGTDLVEALCREGSKRGFTTAFLGGGERVAEQAAERLGQKYKNLRVAFCEDGGLVDRDGSYDGRLFPDVDVMFVAFGMQKQEKWMFKNLSRVSVKVMMGVGGALDYFSGVPRAPGTVRKLGLEWLFRLVVQPQRLGRQLKIIGFVLHLVAFGK